MGALLGNFLFLWFLKQFSERSTTGGLRRGFVNEHHRLKPFFSFLLLILYFSANREPILHKTKIVTATISVKEFTFTAAQMHREQLAFKCLS